MTRREALCRVGLAGLSAAIVPSAFESGLAAQKVIKNGRLKQSVCRWPFAKIPLPDFCRAVAEIGLPGIDLVGATDWDTLKQYGLICTMGQGFGGSIANGFNNPALHDKLVQSLTDGLGRAAKAGVPNVITFFGNRQPGMSDAQAMENCVTGLNRVKAVAEDQGVTVCVELLNSLVDHKGYQGDHAAFGLEVVKAVASPRVKLLYDIYHMQIMDGNIIATIRGNIQHIAHFHTGGVPGRHELDATQELNWAAVCRAIVDAGFAGYVAHEFVPTRDPLTSLREAAALCDVA